jgi:heparosan-N-sulfate-glucuronate 5-epimerase
MEARGAPVSPAGFTVEGRLFSLPSFRRGFDAAFSHGPSYEPIPPGRRFDAGHIRGYYMDFRAKTLAGAAPAALLPAALAQLGLGWWERALEGEEGARAEVDRVCALLLERAVGAGDELRWIYEVEVPKYGLAPPFASALAQGQIASLFVRAGLGGDASLLAAARRAVRPLLAERTSDLVTITAAGPVLEEVPTAPRSHVLNGWISALWGLRDVALALDDAAVWKRHDESLGALQTLLPLYDTGWWTKYSLYPFDEGDLAKPIYHRFHADQLEVLSRLTNSPEFAVAAERWRGYDTRRGRAWAVAVKARFVARLAWGRVAVGGDPVEAVR